MATQNVEVSVVGGVTSVNIPEAHISIKGKDEVIWHTRLDEPFAVTFPGGGPFASVLFVGKKDKPAHSKAAVIPAVGHDYKYIVQVLGAAALDPVVHTDP
jgi:hypothetical protein